MKHDNSSSFGEGEVNSNIVRKIKQKTNNKQYLDGARKPSAKQAAWVIACIVDHLNNGGTYRYLIYDRMGYKPRDYCTLLEAGGMVLSNALNEVEVERYPQKERPA